MIYKLDLCKNDENLIISIKKIEKPKKETKNVIKKGIKKMILNHSLIQSKQSKMKMKKIYELVDESL